MFPLFVFLLVLSGIGQSVGFAILGGWRNKGVGQERRQAITPFLPPPMSTIFLDGDSSKPKTASAGYSAQIDIINDIWGFCPTSAPVQKCGLPGSCVDSHACSNGCGFTDDSSLLTITWYVDSTLPEIPETAFRRADSTVRKTATTTA